MEMYTGTLLGERCTDSGAGPRRPAGAGVGGLYSSGVPVDTAMCALAVALA